MELKTPVFSFEYKSIGITVDSSYYLKCTFKNLLAIKPSISIPATKNLITLMLLIHKEKLIAKINKPCNGYQKVLISSFAY